MYAKSNKSTKEQEEVPEIIEITKPQISEITEPYRPQIFQNGWRLVWADEFDDVEITIKNWTIEDLVAKQNNELQYYSTNNVKVANGLLTIISKEESAHGRNFTSGAVHTKNTFNFLYGKVEMKAKLPKGQGIFPAFWMMTNKVNTWLPEIDILEMVGHKPNEIWMVLHGLDESNEKKTVAHSFIGEDYSNAFHTYGLEWTPTKLIWLIDGEIKFETEKYIPQEEMYLYINTAVGGNWPGNPDHTTQFPTFFEIDYVRIYQKDGIN